MSDWQLTAQELDALPARILVFGAGGQIGRAACLLLGSRAQPVTRDACDLAQAGSLLAYLEEAQPMAIFNAAAYTAVDKAEEEGELAYAINAHAPHVMAAYAAEHGIPLVHFSTDYVYDGQGDAPHQETSTIAPLSVYGESKAKGDAFIAESGAKHLIFRTSWVYDGVGNNFLRTMLRLGKERDALSVVSDQVGAPSYAPHLAAAACKALVCAELAGSFPSGVYHLVNEGSASWHGFAEAIFDEARGRSIPLAIADVSSILTKDYPTAAQRPLNSRLSTDLLSQRFGFTLPKWQDALREAMEQYVQTEHNMTLA